MFQRFVSIIVGNIILVPEVELYRGGTERCTFGATAWLRVHGDRIYVCYELDLQKTSKVKIQLPSVTLCCQNNPSSTTSSIRDVKYDHIYTETFLGKA